MRIAFIVDGRVEHARRWLTEFGKKSSATLVLSTHPCDGLDGHDIVHLPHLFPASSIAGGGATALRLNPAMQYLWQQLRTLEVPLQASAARSHLSRFRPDLIHAMRIQNEGYVAAAAANCPWVLSTWGADFVLFGRKYPVHRWLTSRLLKKPDGLIVDCQRDMRLALELGYLKARPLTQFPGNGGVDLKVFTPGPDPSGREPLIVFPRGFSSYMRAKTLIEAIRIVESRALPLKLNYLFLVRPNSVNYAGTMLRKARLPSESTHVAPFLDKIGLSDLLRRAMAIVSPSVVDGTPNVMLEAMASGTFPIMSRLDSIGEWIDEGQNGLLFNPEDPQELADCICRAVQDGNLRCGSALANARIVRERADLTEFLPRVGRFYSEVLEKARDRRGA
jgi:glycosyltransferase involved in cell wall biosynthesis